MDGDRPRGGLYKRREEERRCKERDSYSIVGVVASAANGKMGLGGANIGIKEERGAFGFDSPNHQKQNRNA